VYICLCNSVTDSDIRRVADDGVRNMKQLKTETGCGMGCGKCIEAAKSVLDEALHHNRQFLQIVSNTSAA